MAMLNNQMVYEITIFLKVCNGLYNFHTLDDGIVWCYVYSMLLGFNGDNHGFSCYFYG